MKPQSLPLFVRTGAEPVQKHAHVKHDKKASLDEAAFGAKLATALAVDPVPPPTAWPDKPLGFQPPTARSERPPTPTLATVELPRVRKTTPPVAAKAAPAKNDTTLLVEPRQSERSKTTDEPVNHAVGVVIEPPSPTRPDVQLPSLGAHWVAPAKPDEPELPAPVARLPAPPPTSAAVVGKVATMTTITKPALPAREPEQPMLAPDVVTPRAAAATPTFAAPSIQAAPSSFATARAAAIREVVTPVPPRPETPVDASAARDSAASSIETADPPAKQPLPAPTATFVPLPVLAPSLFASAPKLAPPQPSGPLPANASPRAPAVRQTVVVTPAAEAAASSPPTVRPAPASPSAKLDQRPAVEATSTPPRTVALPTLPNSPAHNESLPTALTPPLATVPPSTISGVAPVAGHSAQASTGRATVKDTSAATDTATLQPTQAPASETLAVAPQSRPHASAAVFTAPQNLPVVGDQRPAEPAQSSHGGHSERHDSHQPSRGNEPQAELKQPLPSPSLPAVAAPASPTAASSLPAPQPSNAQSIAVHISPRASEPSASTTRASLLTGTDLLDLAPLGSEKIDLHNNEARVSVDTDSGALSLHVRVRHGVTDVSVDGHAAAHVGSHSRDLEAYLQKEGLTLGRFTVDEPRLRSGDSFDTDGRQSQDSRQDADEGDGTGHADSGTERPVPGEPAKVRSSRRVHVKA